MPKNKKELENKDSKAELSFDEQVKKAVDAQIQDAVANALKQKELEDKRNAGLEKARREKDKKGIYIVYGGTYYHKENATKSARSYEVELQLIDNPFYRLPKDDKLVQIGRIKLLPHYFKNEARKEYPFFEAVREVKILDIKTYGGKETKAEEKDIDKPIEKMTMKQLVKFTVEKDLLTNPNTFSTVGAARSAVEEEWENRKIAERDQYGIDQQEEEKKSNEFADVKELLEFNNIDV